MKHTGVLMLAMVALSGCAATKQPFVSDAASCIKQGVDAIEVMELQASKGYVTSVFSSTQKDTNKHRDRLETYNYTMLMSDLIERTYQDVEGVSYTLIEDEQWIKIEVNFDVQKMPTSELARLGFPISDTSNQVSMDALIRQYNNSGFKCNI